MLLQPPEAIQLETAANNNLIKSFDIGNNFMDIHHLQFADETILFSPYEDLSLINMFNIIRLLGSM